MNIMTPEKRDELNVKMRELAVAKDWNGIEALMMPYSKSTGICTTRFQLYTDEKFPILQGGGTDGKYLYFAHVTWVKDDIQTGIICKYDPETGELIKKSEEMPIDHANDITYNPKTGMLIVVHNAPNRRFISYLNPETLEYLGSHDIGNEIYCMSYNEQRDAYIVGKSGGMDFALLDADFIKQQDFVSANTRYVTQGMETDDDFIYFILHRLPCITKYDWDGNFVEYIPLDRKSDEPENIMFVGGKLYLGYNVWKKGGIGTPELVEVKIVENKA